MGLLFYGAFTSYDLKNHFNERISDLNLNKILQVSTDVPSVNLNFTEMFKAIMKSLNYPNLLTSTAVPYTQFIVHSKQELNQLTGKSRKLSEAVSPYFMILLIEEVTAPASLEALYFHFHFGQPGGLRTERSRKGWSVFDHLLSKLWITGRAFQKVNVHFASFPNFL